MLSLRCGKFGLLKEDKEVSRIELRILLLLIIMVVGPVLIVKAMLNDRRINVRRKSTKHKRSD